MNRGRLYYYVLQSESSSRSGSSSESPTSIQGRVTDLARDTSDLETPTESSVDSVIEYEVATSEDDLPDNRPQFVDSNDSSGTSNRETFATAVIRDTPSDGELVIVISDDTMSATPSDSVLGPSYYWKCAQCRNDNGIPMFRYCEKCYKMRKDVFPPRPIRKRPKRAVTRKSTSSSARDESEPSEVRAKENRKRQIAIEGGDPSVKRVKQNMCQLLINLNNDAIPSGRSAFAVPPIETLDGPAVGADSIPRKCGSAENETPDGPELHPVNAGERSENDLCITCFVESKSGVFVHGRNAHICCCYKCAVKVWMKNRRCPVCNCRVSNVLKAYVV